MVNLNGQTLKIAFLLVVITLCMVFLLCTIGVAFKIIEMSAYEQILGVTGCVGFFTMIGQAFIHANINDVPEEVKPKAPLQQKVD